MDAAPILPPVPLGAAEWGFSRTCVFGVVNVTPDSFYDGGSFACTSEAIAHGMRLIEQGADVVDIGGESTRPGATAVEVDEELRRVIPVIAGLAARTEAAISIDTYKAPVARGAIAAGARIVNDISGGRLGGPEMLSVVAAGGATIVLGHLRGEPQTMQQGIDFADPVADVIAELRQRVRSAIEAGIAPERIWVDPGIGFGKSAAHSLALLRAVGQIRAALGYPVLVGPSRKSFLGQVTGEAVSQRLMGTCAACVAAVMAGADAVRVHDVEALRSGLCVVDAIRRGYDGSCQRPGRAAESGAGPPAPGCHPV